MREETQLRAHIAAIANHNNWLVAHADPEASDGPDLILVHPDWGRLVVAVCKSNRGRVESDQMRWLMAFAAAGAETHIWRPEDLTEPIEVSPVGQVLMQPGEPRPWETSRDVLEQLARQGEGSDELTSQEHAERDAQPDLSELELIEAVVEVSPLILVHLIERAGRTVFLPTAVLTRLARNAGYDVRWEAETGSVVLSPRNSSADIEAFQRGPAN